MSNLVFFWFRRDLRLHDNTGLYHALHSKNQVIPVFIYDSRILNNLAEKKDPRVEFISVRLAQLDKALKAAGSSLFVFTGEPLQVWQKIISKFPGKAVYTNEDYEPQALERDQKVAAFLHSQAVAFYSFKDQVIFSPKEVVKDDSTPYTVFGAFKRKWMRLVSPAHYHSYPTEELFSQFYKSQPQEHPAIADLGFQKTGYQFPPGKIDPEIIVNYHKTRDYPAKSGTTRLGLHLRFGTVSVRELVALAMDLNDTWLGELIWREFFMMILYHFPQVACQSFRPAYDRIAWHNNNDDFQRWCAGQTGYPLVDAGMRELNATGFMHNRTRMVTASFLCKHLLIDWRWGEQYFAAKLLDYDLAANNGNWQWAAGTGCDAAPYFRVFNPALQQKRFDPDFAYIKKWLPEFGSQNYPQPMVEHNLARNRAIAVYKQALQE